jgi:hypothetical protein
MAIPFYDENLYILNVKNDLEAKVTKYETFLLRNLASDYVLIIEVSKLG